jgi:hypothetical protein
MNFGMEPRKMKRNNRGMGKTLRKRWNEMSDYDVDDVLEVFGLRRTPKASSRFFSGLGLVLGGAVVGVALGMMFSPKSRRVYPHVQAPMRHTRPPQPGGHMGAP